MEIKRFKDYEKVNEEFQIFGMDVVITLGELIEGAALIIVISLGLAYFGYAGLKYWLKDIISDKRKIKSLKKLSKIVNKYKDDKVDGYIHDINTAIYHIKTDKGDVVMTRKKYIELSDYLKNKMSKEDRIEYENVLDVLGI